MFYRNIFKKSFLEITWKNKYLWFFGFFAIFLGSSGELSIFYRGLSGNIGKNYFVGFQRFLDTGFLSWQTLLNIGTLIKKDPFSVLILLGLWLIILILFCFFLWLAVISQASLVNNSAKLVSRKKTSFQDGVLTGMAKFWPVLSLDILIKILIFLAFILIGIPTFFQNFNSPSSGWIYIVLFIIFIPTAIIFSFILKYSIAYIVIKEKRLLSSLKEGWKLFMANWLVSIEMALTLFFINIMVHFLTFIIGFTLMSILFFIAVILGKSLSVFLFWLLIILGAVLVVFLAAAVEAALKTFYVSSWTILFIELIGNKGSSKIVRLVENFKNRSSV